MQIADCGLRKESELSARIASGRSVSAVRNPQSAPSLTIREGFMLTLREAMTEDVFTLDPETTLRSAVEQLAARHVSGAPVVSGDKIVGTLSANDVVSFVATTP